LRRNGVKGMGLCKEDFIYDTGISIVLKFLARILVKAENPSECVTVNCEVRRLAAAL
jgi:hypothetical protein